MHPRLLLIPAALALGAVSCGTKSASAPTTVPRYRPPTTTYTAPNAPLARRVPSIPSTPVTPYYPPTSSMQDYDRERRAKDQERRIQELEREQSRAEDCRRVGGSSCY